VWDKIDHELFSHLTLRTQASGGQFRDVLQCSLLVDNRNCPYYTSTKYIFMSLSRDRLLYFHICKYWTAPKGHEGCPWEIRALQLHLLFSNKISSSGEREREGEEQRKVALNIGVQFRPYSFIVGYQRNRMLDNFLRTQLQIFKVCRDPSRWPRGTLYLQKLALTSRQAVVTRSV
jgi:hypothetical protein